MPLRRLADLAKPEFERLVSRLYWSALSREGAFWPNPSGVGETDGGYDGQYRGPYGGRTESWRVSAKHVLATDSVKALQDALRRDFALHRDAAWLVVTNVVLRPEQRARLERWARRQPVRTVAFDDGNVVAGLCELHPHVARAFTLAGDALVVRPVPAPRPLPAPWLEAVERVLAALPHRHVALRGPDGVGHALVLEVLGRRLEQVDGAPFPLWLELADDHQLAALEREVLDLPLETSRYVFLVPKPSPAMLRRVLDLARRGDHAVVFATSGQETPLVAAVTIDLVEPDGGEVREWLGRVLPTARVDFLSQVFGLCGGRPGDCLDWLGGQLPGVTERVRRLFHEWSPTDPVHRLAHEVLGLIVLSLPVLHEQLDCDWIGALTGASPHDIDRVLHDAVRRDLVRTGDDRVFTDFSLVQSAAIVDLCSLRPACVARLRERPHLAVRMAQLSGDEGPLHRVLDADIAIVRSGAFGSVRASIERALDVASFSKDTAGRVLAIGLAASARAGRGPAFAEDDHALVRERCPAILRNDAVRVLSAVVGEISSMAVAVRELLALARAGSSVRWKAVAASIAGPNHAHRPASAAFAVLREALATPDAHVLELARETTELWVRADVEVGGSFGWTFTMGRTGWNEESPEVAPRRADALGVLWREVRSDVEAVRLAGWSAWAMVWHGRPNGPCMPEVFVDAVHELLGFAAGRVGAAGWSERAVIESLVLGWVAHPEIERTRIAAAIRAFPTDPLYQAWRLLAHPRLYVEDPAALADAVESGASWADVVHATIGATRGDLGLAESVAQRLAQTPRGADGLMRLLREAARPRAEGGWYGTSVLGRWMQYDRDRFVPVLLGPGWREVPPEGRGLLLAAARPVFTADLLDAMDSTLEPPGAAAVLATLMRSPSTMEPSDVIELVGALCTLLPPERKPELLARLADHEDVRVRERALLLLTHDLHYAQDAPTAVAGGLVLARFFPPGDARPGDEVLVRAVFSELRHVGSDRSVVVDRALDEARDGLVPRLEHAAPDEDGSSLSRFVVRAWRASPDACIAALGRAARAHPSSVLLPDLPPDVAARALAIALGQDVPEDAEGFWGHVIERLARSLDDEQVADLVRSARSRRLKTILLASYAPTGEQMYLDLLAEWLVAADDASRALIVEGVACASRSRMRGLPRDRGDVLTQRVRAAAAARTEPERNALLVLAGAIDAVRDGLRTRVLVAP